jgi:hypothetical protein
MSFYSEDYAYNKLLKKIGGPGWVSKSSLLRVVIPIFVCWLPLAVITIFNHTFWTGNASTSFISNLDTQARLLISMPILILAQRIIMPKLDLVLGQFVNSGIVRSEERGIFDEIIKRKSRFLSSGWTDLAIFVFCYAHSLFMGFIYNPDLSLHTWNTLSTGGEIIPSFAGWWSLLVSRPAVLFLFYRWLMYIIVWTIILRKISKLNLNIYTVHPDLSGGLGFLGYSIRYFTPVAFAISAAVAGRMIDAILIGGSHVSDLKISFLIYFVIITLLFAAPLLSFISKLINARDKAIFENNDFANGLFRELQKKTSKDFDKVSAEDLTIPDYSATADFSSVINNTLKMRFVPFGLKDFIALWVMTALPFIFVVLVEVPLFELVKKVLNLIA